MKIQHHYVQYTPLKKKSRLKQLYIPKIIEGQKPIKMSFQRTPLFLQIYSVYILKLIHFNSIP